MLEYHVQISNPHTHTFTNTVSFTAPVDKPVLHLPVWTPGSYLVREFARFVGEWTATVNGNPATLGRPNKSAWQVACKKGDRVMVKFEVYGHELTVRTPHIDGSHAFFLGVNVFPYLRETLAEKHVVCIDAPDAWTVFTPLSANNEGRYEAPDYETLADTQFEVGPHRVDAFDVDGVSHRVIWWGDDAVRIDHAKVCADIAKLVATNAGLFGGLPYPNYDFVLHITRDSGGGLEHKNGSVNATPWHYFDTEDGYKDMLRLLAHEHFHVWNGKRIRPQALGPFDFQNENYTEALWVVEGITSYYDELICVRSGHYDQETFLSMLAESLTALSKVPGRDVQSLTLSSFDAWIRLYRPDDNIGNRTVSYYLKGSIAGLLLDLTIRHRTDGAKSLDDVMRTLWADFVATGKGYADDAIPSVVQRATGLDLAEEIASWTATTDRLPVASALATHGVTLTEEASDAGAWFGINARPAPEGVHVKSVRSDGPSAGSALYAGDLILAVNQRHATAATWSAVLKATRGGEPAALHVVRRGRLLRIQVTPAEAAPPSFKCVVDEAATPQAKARLAKWLPTNSASGWLPG